jgi:chromosome partitioning protein
MRLVLAVAGRKGGAGKTTTALNLAGALAECGLVVTMIDLDPQSSLARLVRDGQVRDCGAQAEMYAAHGDVATWLRGQLPADGVILVDTPPHLGIIMDAAISVADRVVLPTRLAQQDIDSLLDTLQRCPQGALILPNAVAPRARLHRDTIAALRERYDGCVARQEIPNAIVIEEALAAGQPVVRYRKRSAPAAAYRSLAQEVVS